MRGRPLSGLQGLAVAVGIGWQPAVGAHLISLGFLVRIEAAGGRPPRSNVLAGRVCRIHTD